MFHLGSDDVRYFSGRGRTTRGPLTIQEHLHRYGVALREASKDAAMAVLPDEIEDGRWSTCCSGTIRCHWWTRLPQGGTGPTN